MKQEWTFEDFLAIIQQRTVETGVCAHEKVFKIFQGKWNIHVLFQLTKYPSMRFGQLQKTIPQITNTMLIKTLKELEQFGVVQRIQYNEIPPHVEYSLSESGKAFLPIFYEIAKWGYKYLS